MPLNPLGKQGIPSPASVGAAKYITLTNNSSDFIYPFLRGQNNGVDPNSVPPAPYDPQDRVDHEFREYIGYSTSDGSKYLGLPKGASITVQVPLVLWDGDNLYIATDGTNLTTANIFGYDASAKVSIASSAPVSGTVWVQGSSNYPKGYNPLVMFYYSDGPPITLPNDAPAQLTEVTFRDPYLKHFITDKDQTFPLINYDVSYVNNLVAPVAMAASNVPITYGDPLGATPPTYYGFQDFGWLATDSNTATFEKAISNFINNTKNANIGNYFGNNQGWPEYYNPDSNDLNIPSGANLFANSPLNKDPGLVHTSSYDSNRWLLTSSGDAPIQAGGAGVGQQGFVNDGSNNKIFLANPSRAFINDLKAMLKAGIVNVTFPGSPDVLATVQSFTPNPKSGMPFVTLNSDIASSGMSGKIYAFTRTATDYAVTAITNLWYSWAQYHVQQNENFSTDAVQAALNYYKKPDGTITTEPTNKITLTATPQAPLAPGMTVTATGIPDGTVILRIDGNDIYLSRIPDQDTPASQQYTFGKPVMLEYDPQYTTPFALSFNPAETTNAKLFAASVFAAMAAEAGVNPLPESYLPYSMNLVSQVIQFYAKLPGYDIPDTGPILVGDVRDVVKSILRGVYDFNKVPDQSLWYPDPSTPPAGLTSGQNFNVYNLDPYVWFIHKVQGMSAYGFSVDDDVSNPTATGPLLAANGQDNHFPNNLQIGFGGIGGFNNPNQWFPTIPWGTLPTKANMPIMATISIQPDGDFAGQSIITFTDPDALKYYNQINNPGTGQVGAYISAPGFIVPGTTLIHKGPTSGEIPQIVLSQNAIATDTPISVVITGELTIPKVRLGNRGFETPPQTNPQSHTVNPKGSTTNWKFTDTAGIAGSGSVYTNNNPAAEGTQVGFIHNTGSISLSVMLKAGKAYALSFLAAQLRLDNGNLHAQTLEIRVNNNVIGTFKPSSGDYALFTSAAFKVNTTGKHTITITGTNPLGGDNTALIDAVTITGSVAPTPLRRTFFGIALPLRRLLRRFR